MILRSQANSKKTTPFITPDPTPQKRQRISQDQKNQENVQQSQNPPDEVIKEQKITNVRSTRKNIAIPLKQLYMAFLLIFTLFQMKKEQNFSPGVYLYHLYLLQMAQKTQKYVWTHVFAFVILQSFGLEIIQRNQIHNQWLNFHQIALTIYLALQDEFILAMALLVNSIYFLPVLMFSFAKRYMDGERLHKGQLVIGLVLIISYLGGLEQTLELVNRQNLIQNYTQ